MVLIVLIVTVIIAFLWILSVYVLEVSPDSKIQTGYCAVNQLTIAYRITRHKQICKDHRLMKLVPKNRTIKSISICYSSNGQPVDARKHYEVLHSSEVYAVGVILSEEGCTVPDEGSALAAKLGYKIVTFPNITHAVTACYSVKSLVSKASAIQHVYPVLQQIINAHHLCAYPRFEIYDKNGIQVIIPLSRQICYFVPEVVPPSPYEWYLSNARPPDHAEQDN